jgi:hypothetical protein
MMSLIVPLHGISTSCCPKPFHFRFQWRTAFIARELGLAPLLPNCSLLRGAHIERDGLFCGRAYLSVLLRLAIASHRYRHLPLGLDWCSNFCSMGSPGTRLCEAIHSLQLSFQQQLPCCCPLYRGPRPCPRALQWHILLPTHNTWYLKSLDTSWACMSSHAFSPIRPLACRLSWQ